MSAKRLFVSYSGRDRSRVSEVVALLRRRGLSLWYDENEMGAGSLVVDDINRAIGGAKFFVIFWSHQYSRGNWTQAELRAAFHLFVEGGGSRQLIVVRLDDAALPPLLNGSAYVEWNTPTSVTDKIMSSVERFDRLDVGGETGASGFVETGWTDVSDSLLASAATAILEATSRVRRSEPVILVEMPVGSKRKLVMSVIGVILGDAGARSDLRADLDVLQIKERFVAELRKTQAKENLGSMQPAITIALEDRTQEVQDFRNRIRSRLEAMTEKVGFRLPS